MARVPQCGDADYVRCHECLAHHTEAHLAGCPTWDQTVCFWCGAPAYGHDVGACYALHNTT